MQFRWLHLLLSLLFASAPTLGAAAEYFTCDCAAGADPDCIPGDDLAVGDSASPWRTYEATRVAFGGFAAGDVVRFCRGGRFPIGAATRWVNARCRAASPCVVSDYAPSWGSGDEGRPVIVATGGGHGFALEDGGNADHEEGYRFENLILSGSGAPGWGFFLYNDIDDVEIRGVHIEGFAIGVHLAGSNPCSTDPACDGQNDRIALVDSTVVGNSAQGWLGASNGTRIERCDFDRNGSLAVFDHNIYVSGSSGGQTRGIRVLNNRLHAATLDTAGSCQGAPLVVHGNHIDLRIEGNEVWEDPGTAGPGCWGIAVDAGYAAAEGFEDVVIRGNLVRNVGNLGIGVSSCARCTIENNVVIQEPTTKFGGFTGIAAPDRVAGTGDLALDQITVRNNSLWMAAAGGTAIDMTGGGSRHIITSNAVELAGSGGSWACLDVDLVAGSFDVIDHNACWFPSAPGSEWSRGHGTLPTPLAAWQSSGYDVNAIAADPGFANPVGADLTVGPPSALLDSGDPVLASATDFTDRPRDPRPDIGAHEWRGATAEPVIYLTQPTTGPLISYQPAGGRAYDLIRGPLVGVSAIPSHVDLGTVECVALGDRAGSVTDPLPGPLLVGEVRFYLARQRGGGYGRLLDGRPSLPAAGDCP